MTEAELGWVVGLFEGEGCIHIKEGKYAQLSLTTTDEDVLLRFFSLVEAGLLTKCPQVEGNKLAHRWSVGEAGEVRSLLVQMLPLLGERRRAKAIEAIERADFLLSKVCEKTCICGVAFTPANTRIASRQKFCSKVCMRRHMMIAYKRRKVLAA